MPSFTRQTIKTTLSAALAPAGTLTIGYPAFCNSGTFLNAVSHRIATANGDVYKSPKHFTLAFGTASIVLTWGTNSPTLPINTFLNIQLDVAGAAPQWNAEARAPAINNCAAVDFKMLLIGAPVAAVAAGVSASQGVGIAGSFLLNGSLLSGGRMIFDVPRNVVAAWTTASVITVTGKDEYGNKLVEASASGTSFTGKKAFKEITSVTSSVAITAATVGTGVVLGLPVFLPAAGYVVKELVSNAVVTTGTFVGGKMDAAQSATTGDVRGTYAPASAPDGTINYMLIVGLADSDFLGDDQFAG